MSRVGITPLVQYIRQHGVAPVVAEYHTSFGSDSEDRDGSGPRPTTTVRRTYDNRYEVVRIPALIVVAGPFDTFEEADKHAAIARMEKAAEKISAAAIKAMARRAEEG